MEDAKRTSTLTQSAGWFCDRGLQSMIRCNSDFELRLLPNAASWGGLLCAVRRETSRFQTSIMIQQFWWRAVHASASNRQVDTCLRLKNRLIGSFSSYGNPKNRSVGSARLTCRQPRQNYGLVDKLIKSRKEIKLLDGAVPDRSTAIAEAALPRKLEE